MAKDNKQLATGGFHLSIGDRVANSVMGDGTSRVAGQKNTGGGRDGAPFREDGSRPATLIKPIADTYRSTKAAAATDAGMIMAEVYDAIWGKGLKLCGLRP
jgi:hypothetical protein